MPVPPTVITLFGSGLSLECFDFYTEVFYVIECFANQLSEEGISADAPAGEQQRCYADNYKNPCC